MFERPSIDAERRLASIDLPSKPKQPRFQQPKDFAKLNFKGFSNFNQILSEFHYFINGETSSNTYVKDIPPSPINIQYVLLSTHLAIILL